jgi:hypothetical protein
LTSTWCKAWQSELRRARLRLRVLDRSGMCACEHRAISTEARAMNNVGLAGNSFWARTFPEPVHPSTSPFTPRGACCALLQQISTSSATRAGDEGRRRLARILTSPRRFRSLDCCACCSSNQPCLQYVLAFVTNMQGSDPTYLKVSSCCKHYAA